MSPRRSALKTRGGGGRVGAKFVKYNYHKYLLTSPYGPPKSPMFSQRIELLRGSKSGSKKKKKWKGRRGNACPQTHVSREALIDISRFRSFVNWQLVKIEASITSRLPRDRGVHAHCCIMGNRGKMRGNCEDLYWICIVLISRLTLESYMWLCLIWNLSKCRKEMICPEQFTPPAMSFARSRCSWFCREGALRPVSKRFSTIRAIKFPINKKKLFISKSWKIICQWVPGDNSRSKITRA